MNPCYGPDYTFTLDFDCLVVRWHQTADAIGKYRVITSGFFATFMPSCTAVVDDFGNLVRVSA